jgi:type VI secretion system lysozyme-like protein
MAQLDLPSTLMPSLKDRLLDPDSTGTKGQPGYTLRQVFDSVREDVEELLNARRSHLILDTKYPELARSIAAYGLPDLSSMDTSTAGKQEQVGHVIEKIIALFEPRLRKVRIQLVRSRATDMRATFHIDAELSVDPFPLVAFESVLDLATGRASIREREG